MSAITYSQSCLAALNDARSEGYRAIAMKLARCADEEKSHRIQEEIKSRSTKNAIEILRAQIDGDLTDGQCLSLIEILWDQLSGSHRSFGEEFQTHRMIETVIDLMRSAMKRIENPRFPDSGDVQNIAYERKVQREFDERITA